MLPLHYQPIEMKGIAPISIILEIIILLLNYIIRMIGLEPITFDTQNQNSTIKLHSEKIEDHGI